MSQLSGLVRELSDSIRTRIDETERKVLAAIVVSAFVAGFLGAALGAKLGRR